MEIFNVFAPVWNAIFIQPLVNVMVVTYALLGHNFVLAVLAATILVQLVTFPLTMNMPSADPQASAMNNQMQVMMPVMFGFFALNFPSGLAAYWIISSLVRMAFQGVTQGWQGVLPAGLSMPSFLRPGAGQGSMLN